jgi:hypothetical protein
VQAAQAEGPEPEGVAGRDQGVAGHQAQGIGPLGLGDGLEQGVVQSVFQMPDQQMDVTSESMVVWKNGPASSSRFAQVAGVGQVAVMAEGERVPAELDQQGWAS